MGKVKREINASKIKEMLMHIYLAYANKDIDEKEVKNQLAILSSMLKCIEVSDLQKQYDELKGILLKNKQ